MTDKETEFAEFTAVAERFIALANEIKSEGKPLPLVNAAFMSASATYSTYVAAGNEGYLKPSGIDRLVDAYRAQLANIQEIKRKSVESAGKKESKDS
jgi:DNA-binding NarL/FixJ family response regulator